MIKRILFSLALLVSVAFVGPATVTFAGPVAVAALKPNAPFSPSQLANNAAWYSLAGSASDNTYLLNGGNVTLIADRSGNSAVNGLVLNGATGQYATSNAPATLLTGDLDIRFFASLASWAPAVECGLLNRGNIGGAYSWLVYLKTDGKLLIQWKNGSGVQKSATSSVAVGAAAYANKWVRIVLDVDNGASGSDVLFYTSDDGSTWTPLGTTQTVGSTAGLSAGTSYVQIGAGDSAYEPCTGIVYRAQIYNGIAGTLVFDANFTTQAKLATSFTESSANAATVTINTSGDLGARICGARDLVQLTAAKQPAFSVVGGYNTATGDGVDDYMKAAAFSFSQPESVYFVGSQVTWTLNDEIFDGFTSGQRMAIIQLGTTPEIDLFAGTVAPANTAWPVATKAVLRAIFNGAASSLGVNLSAATTGNANTQSGGGFTLGAANDGSTAANITFNEVILRSVADDATTQLRLAGYEMKKWEVP